MSGKTPARLLVKKLSRFPLAASIARYMYELSGNTEGATMSTDKREIYHSNNGDRWLLRSDEDGRPFIEHRANPACRWQSDADRNRSLPWTGKIWAGASSSAPIDRRTRWREVIERNDTI
jgi:hypothetical protein